MSVEFRPDNQSSFGEEKLSFQNGTTIPGAGVFTEALPPGFPTKKYPLFQYPSSFRRHGRWVVAVDIVVSDGLLRLQEPMRPSPQVSPQGAHPSASAQPSSQESDSIIPDGYFSNRGLPVVILYKDNLHSGRLHSTSSKLPAK